MSRDTAQFLATLLATSMCLIKSPLATSAAAPHVAHPTLPPALRRSQRVAGCLRVAVTLDALLHLFVDLEQRQAAGATHAGAPTTSPGVHTLSRPCIFAAYKALSAP